MDNRGTATTGKDTWLTPPELLDLLGHFDLDPCCPPYMPWRTADEMISLPEDGLTAKWHGRVWCNPPYSDPAPWITRMAEHHNGIMLLPAKSSDSKWGQLVLKTADAVMFQAGRLLFHFPDGTKSTGKWSPMMLAAYGRQNVAVLRSARLADYYPGVVMIRVQ